MFMGGSYDVYDVYPKHAFVLFFFVLTRCR